MKVGKWRGVRSFEGGVENRRDHRGKKKGGKAKKIKNSVKKANSRVKERAKEDNKRLRRH